MNSLLITLLVALQASATTGAGTVTGRLFSSTGNPAVNVRVGLSSAAGEGGALIGLTQTSNTGAYRIEGVPPGQYYVLAGLVESPTYAPGALARTNATIITVTARSTLNVPDFRLAPQSGGLRVRGRVIREWLAAGEAAPAMSVRLRPPVQRGSSTSGGTTFSADVAADGSYEIPSVPPGRYRAQVFGSMQPMPEQDVLVDRDIDNLRLTVPLSSVRATVQGTLRLDGIGPLPSLVEVHLANPERPIDGWVFVGDSLSIPLVPLGEYAVRLGPLPQGYSLKAMTAGSVDLLSGKLKVTPSGLAPIVVTLRVASPLPGVRIEGRISNRGESRLPIQIRISGVVPGLTLAAPILEDGSFSWPLVPAGNYRVEFVPPVDSAERTMSVGQRNPASIEVPLRLSNFRSVSVTVVRPPSIVDPPPPVRALRPVLRNVERPNDLILAGQTADGTFEFLNVEPGTYQVLLSEPGPRGANVLSNPVVPIVVADKDITGVQIFVP